MSVAFTAITRNADGTWTFTWAGTGPFRVVERGSLLDIVTASPYRSRPSTTPPALEIVLEDEVALSEQYPPRVRIQWYQDPEASSYTVERDTGSGYATAKSISEEGKPVSEYTTPKGADGDEILLRVKAVGEFGDVSTAVEYEGKIVTLPLPPDVETNYASGNITVTNA